MSSFSSLIFDSVLCASAEGVVGWGKEEGGRRKEEGGGGVG